MEYVKNKEEPWQEDRQRHQVGRAYFVYVLSIATMFGHTTLCIIVLMMAEHSERSTSWMITAENALQSG